MDFKGILDLKSMFLKKSGLSDVKLQLGPYNVDYQDDFGTHTAHTVMVYWEKDGNTFGCLVEPEIKERRAKLEFDEALHYTLKRKGIPEVEKTVDFTKKLWELADAIRNGTAETNSQSNI
jgi:hypothetical protein